LGGDRRVSGAGEERGLAAGAAAAFCGRIGEEHEKELESSEAGAAGIRGTTGCFHGDQIKSSGGASVPWEDSALCAWNSPEVYCSGAGETERIKSEQCSDMVFDDVL
jgi:hypothetical protein